jgi:HD-GYP domain-containing protein (c-di-GMP phosphodiesterase class II)
LLDRLPFPAAFADIPFIASSHHEKLDGSGYYRGLKGDEIPLLARILTVSNEFDNLTSIRHSGERLTIAEAKEILLKEREHRLDAAVVDALTELAADRLAEIMESGPNFVLS